MNFIVTGAAGFVASHVVDALLARGDRVYAIDNFVTGSPANLEAASTHSDFSLRTADISTDAEKILDWLRERAGGYDAILHMASPASPVDYKRLPIETLAVNAYGTDFCCRLAALFGARLLYTSTSEVYGDPLEHPQRETYWGNVNPIGSRSCYDEGKRFGEAMIMAHVRVAGIDARIVRIFNTYGPRMRIGDGRVVPNFIAQALSKQPLTIYGDGKQTRSFCYIDDCLEGLHRLMRSDFREPLNLGQDRMVTINQLADMVAEIAGFRIVKKHIAGPMGVRGRNSDNTLLRQTLGWEPEISLEEGLAKTYRWIEDQARERMLETAAAKA